MKAEEVWNGKAHILWWVSISFVVPEPFKAQKLFLDLKGPVDGSDKSGGRWAEKAEIWKNHSYTSTACWGNS